MHQYLIFMLSGPEILRTNARYGHNQSIKIDGHTFTAHHYHYGDKGPYGVLIMQSNPKSHEQIRDAIDRTGVIPLPW